MPSTTDRIDEIEPIVLENVTENETAKKSY